MATESPRHPGAHEARICPPLGRPHTFARGPWPRKAACRTRHGEAGPWSLGASPLLHTHPWPPRPALRSHRRRAGHARGSQPGASPPRRQQLGADGPTQRVLSQSGLGRPCQVRMRLGKPRGLTGNVPRHQGAPDPRRLATAEPPLSQARPCAQCAQCAHPTRCCAATRYPSRPVTPPATSRSPPRRRRAPSPAHEETPPSQSEGGAKGKRKGVSVPLWATPCPRPARG
jgi:hypothetical protein